MFVFSKVAQSFPGSFNLRKKPQKTQIFLYGKNFRERDVILFNILMVLMSQKFSEDCSSLSTELLSSVNKNSTILYIYLMLQLKDENKASYFYVQGAQ